MYMYVYTLMCIHIDVYGYTYIHTNTQTHTALQKRTKFLLRPIMVMATSSLFAMEDVLYSLFSCLDSISVLVGQEIIIPTYSQFTIYGIIPLR